MMMMLSGVADGTCQAATWLWRGRRWREARATSFPEGGAIPLDDRPTFLYE